MTRLAAASLAAAGAAILALTVPSFAEDISEPKSGVQFAAKSGDMSLLGVGLRTKTMLKVKVYAIGLYVADSALAGPLAAHKGKPTTPALFDELVSGDFEKEVRLKFVRDVTASQIQEAFRESLAGATGSRVDQFVGYFPDTKVGQEYVLHYAPGGTLDVTAAGLKKVPIADKAFASRVFAIWLGPKPIQEEIKQGLVSRR